MPTDDRKSRGLRLRPAVVTDRYAVCALLAAERAGREDSPTAHAPPALADPAAHDWLYWDNPYGPPHNFVWEDDGRIVAHAGLYPGLGLVEGRVVRIGRIAHLVTARGYRGRGLYGSLARRQQEVLGRDLDLLIALPTPAAIAALEGAGVMRRDRAQRWFRPVGEDFADLRGVPRPLAATLTRVAFGPPPAPEGERVDALPDDLDDLARSTDVDGVLADRMWWRWRIVDHPVHDYDLYARRVGGRTTAMLAARPLSTMGATFLQVLHHQAVDAAAAEGILGAALADHPECIAATLLATDGSEPAEWARRAGMHRLPAILDDTSGHIALASAPGEGAVVPGRHWSVSLASHHDA
ncbi:GNAT family N-acetyltransferase [Euzebya sp.]|uniref:GNAT family N-acetyltransferase n=1 Tax=Euzebya sp. TaxID=1971409 RepID=UPI00351789FF